MGISLQLKREFARRKKISADRLSVGDYVYINGVIFELTTIDNRGGKMIFDRIIIDGGNVYRDSEMHLPVQNRYLFTPIIHDEIMHIADFP